MLHSLTAEPKAQCSISNGMSISCKVSTSFVCKWKRAHARRWHCTAGWLICLHSCIYLQDKVRTCINAFRRSVPKQSFHSQVQKNHRVLIRSQHQDSRGRTISFVPFKNVPPKDTSLLLELNTFLFQLHLCRFVGLQQHQFCPTGRFKTYRYTLIYCS